MIEARLTYRGYTGGFTFHEETKRFVGKVLDIDPLLTFQGNSIESTRKAFREAIEEYLRWCKRHGKSPSPPSSPEDTLERLSMIGFS